MELKILKQNDQGIRFELAGEDHTFCTILVKALWEQNGMDAAGYMIEHALVSQPRFTVAAKDPKKALLGATDTLRGNLKEWRTALKKL